jgi:hypothetical protein
VGGLQGAFYEGFRKGLRRYKPQYEGREVGGEYMLEELKKYVPQFERAL